MKSAHTFTSCFLAIASLMKGPFQGPAMAQLLGPEFPVNSYTTSYQEGPAVAADSSGNFVVVWSSRYQDGSYSGVFARRFSASGSPVGSEFRINSYTTGNQWNADVARDGSGNFIVVWDTDTVPGFTSEIFGRRFNSAGLPVGNDFQVNVHTTGQQVAPKVAADSLGNFVVVWYSEFQDGDGFGVFARRFSSTGSPLGSEFLVNTFTLGNQLSPSVSADGSGSFVVVWGGTGQSDGGGVFGKRFNSAGSPVGGEFRVNSHIAENQDTPAVAKDASGSFVVVWRSNLQDGSNYGVFGQRFNSAGTPVGTEFLANSYTTASQHGASVAVDQSGNFVVTWVSAYQDGSSVGVFGQRFSSAGNAIGSEFRVNTYTPSYQFDPSVVADGLGNFVVVWNSNQDGSNFGVFGRQLTASVFSDGFVLGNACSWTESIGGGCP